MADTDSGVQPDETHPGSRAWRTRVALLLAVAVAAAGLVLLERSPAASAAPGPRIVLSSRHRVTATSTVDAQVAQIKTVTMQLRGAASLLTQTVPALDVRTAAVAADVAARANHAAILSQQLATLAAAKPVDPAQTTATATALQTALAATQQRAAAVDPPPSIFPIRFCLFTIQIGPIIINIPRLGLHIQIGPFFVRFSAPCFLSGRIPTHIP